MKLHWTEQEVRRGKYRTVKREVSLVFIEHQQAFASPVSENGVNPYDFEPSNPKSYARPVYTVVILRVRGRKGVFSGVARFAAGEDETFSYAHGRKLALGRALRSAFPGKGVGQEITRSKAWYSYRLQAEMDKVKKEQDRQVEKLKAQAHEARRVGLIEALKMAVEQQKQKAAVAVDIEGPAAAAVETMQEALARVKEFTCGCWADAEECPLHSAPPVAGKEVKPDGDDPNAG